MLAITFILKIVFCCATLANASCQYIRKTPYKKVKWFPCISKNKKTWKTSFSAQQEAKKHPSAQFLMCNDFHHLSWRDHVWKKKRTFGTHRKMTVFSIFSCFVKYKEITILFCKVISLYIDNSFLQYLCFKIFKD